MTLGKRFGCLVALMCGMAILAGCSGDDDNAGWTSWGQNRGPRSGNNTNQPQPDPDPQPQPVQNTPPTISGTPPTSVVAGTAYRFAPRASDADGDLLTFRIDNKPSWASFNTSTGVLAGTPSGSHIGTYSNIVIRVTDGEATRQLPAFSITVEPVARGSATLTWTAPTQRTDGSPLTNLAGYKVYWGQQSRSYTQSVEIKNPGVTTYVVDDLARGTYYFATTALSADGLESEYSNEASKTIQ